MLIPQLVAIDTPPRSITSYLAGAAATLALTLALTRTRTLTRYVHRLYGARGVARSLPLDLNELSWFYWFAPLRLRSLYLCDWEDHYAQADPRPAPRLPLAQPLALAVHP